MKAEHAWRVVITRSHEGNAELARKLRAVGMEPVPLDLLSLLPFEDWSEVDRRLSKLRSYDWVLFTSPVGVRYFAERMRHLGFGPGWEAPPRVGAVGERTADALRSNGVRVDFVPEHFLSISLGVELPSKLAGRGFTTEDVAIYRTKGLRVADIGPIRDADVVIFGSPSAVEALCGSLPEGSLTEVTGKIAACIGPVTAGAARSHGFSHIVEPDAHTFDSVVEAIRRIGTGA
ncbi:MAG: uroporphyrinogen-III synthase [Thaumarchaeota archaeon]|nr:MAG: uroporphyrinogen-III synthase [Nitrososphaerota archaeon]